MLRSPRFSLHRPVGTAYHRRVMSTDSPIPLPREQLAALCQRWGIVRLALFGSVLRRDFRPDSDVDVLVEFAPEAKPGFFELSDLSDELSGLLGGRRIDLVTPGGLSPFLRERVLESAQTVHAA